MGRRSLAGRPGKSVDRLLDAAVEALRADGYDQLSMREVSRLAGITHTTMYGYFSSKQHLVAEAYRRRIERWCEQPVAGVTPIQRLEKVFGELGELMAEEPALSTAASAAVLSRDPDVARIRTRTGLLMNERLRRAAGDECPAEVLDGLSLAVSGALIQAGMDYSTYEVMAQRLTRVAVLLLGTVSEITE